YVDLEHYLYSVVGAEVVQSWPIEALKAQAVAARTYALYERAKAQGKLFDVSNTTNSQVYKGITTESNRTHAAVNETNSQVITHGGQLILAAFHASSGGHTENVEDVWTQPLPYLRGVADYDRGAPVYEWSKAIASEALGSKLGIGPARSVRIERTTPRGRVIALSVVGELGSKRLSGEEFRRALNLRSTLFAIAEARGVFQVSGRGFGHGVGMSQWGAYHLALQGTNYQQILGHYYQNATLARVQLQ
ncbi:MAG: SpoIID/LytB domain-containing protein, partial [Cyanobacteria bacterium J06641_5]